MRIFPSILSLDRSARPALLSGLAFLGSAMVGLALSRSTEGIAALWPANAILLSALILSDRPVWRWHVAACAAAGWLANWLDGVAPGLSGVFALANVLGAGLTFRILATRADPRQAFDTTASITLFLIATLLGVGTGATIAAGALWAVAGDHFAAAWLSWAASDFLGMLLVTPLVVTAFRLGRGPRGGVRSAATEWRMWPLALVFVTSLLVFEQSRFPLLFVPLAMVMVATYRLGRLGAVAGTMIVAATGSSLMATGHGPLELVVGSMALRIQFFQFYLATLYGTSMPLAALLAERERLAAESAESDRRHRRILERSREVIFETDLAMRWTYLNPAWETLTGHKIEQAIGRSLLDILAEEDRAAALDCLGPLFRQEIEACRQDLRYVHADGRVLWASVRSHLLVDERGGVIGAYGTIHDVSGRVEAQAARLESERLYRLLADHSNDMIVHFTATGIREYVSPASMALLGYAPEELIGEPAAGAIHPEDRATVLATCRTLLDGVENPICSYRQRHKNGHYVWLEASYRIIRDEATGLPDGFIASVRDIGRRTQAELERTTAAAKLEEANRLLLMAEEMSAVGHWRIDLASGATYLSDTVCAIHGHPSGYSPDLAAATEAFHPEDRPVLRAATQDALASGRGYLLNLRLVRADGVVRQVVLTARTERGPDDSVIGLFGVIQDVTDAHEAEQALIVARIEAEAAATAKTSFLANMSHEIRTPMNGVVGFAELLLAGTLTADQRRYAELIGDSGRAMMRLLNDILDLSKVEAGQMTVANEPFDLAHALKASVSLIAPAVEQKGIALRCHFAADLPRIVSGDALRLRQIVLNLLGNAAKFTVAGEISLTVRRRADGLIVIDVTDTGIGIAADRQRAIFEEFVQADSGIASRFGGTGLGLSISNRLAMLMGGTLTLDSEPGRGTRFTLGLPLRPVEYRAPRQPMDGTTAGLSVRGADIRILVAEDHDVNQLLISAMLEKLACKPDLANDGLEAIAMIDAAMAVGRPYSLVFMDMQMPEMDGVEATRRIRAAEAEGTSLPIIALTANAYQDDIDQCMAAGMQAHVAKPLNLERLDAVLRRWLPTEVEHDASGATRDVAAA